MAVAGSPSQPQYGGYEYAFLGAIPEKYMCSVCSKVLRDPHLTACCGQHFCETCLQQWCMRQGREVCPICQEDNFVHFLNKATKREIERLKIRCSNHKEGCRWMGELGTLNAHLESDKGCGYGEVDCINKCSQRINQKDLAAHLTHYCPLRKYKCQYCGEEDTYQTITKKHYSECPSYPLDCPNMCGVRGIKRAKMSQHQSECPLEAVECSFKEAGCKPTLIRRDFERHMAASTQQHLLLVMGTLQTLKQQSKEVKDDTKAQFRVMKTGVSKVVDHLLLSCTPTQIAPLQSIKELVSGGGLRSVGDQITFTLPDAQQYIQSGRIWHGPPFYYKEGYKMRLDVLLRKTEISNFSCTQTSCSLYLLKGELDEELDWPIGHFNSIEIAFVELSVIRRINFSINPKLNLKPAQKEFETILVGSENIVDITSFSHESIRGTITLKQ